MVESDLRLVQLDDGLGMVATVSMFVPVAPEKGAREIGGWRHLASGEVDRVEGRRGGSCLVNIDCEGWQKEAKSETVEAGAHAGRTGERASKQARRNGFEMSPVSCPCFYISQIWNGRSRCQDGILQHR